MGLQTRDLCMVGLGIEGDAAGTPLQEVLPDGIHLRWAFEPNRGFPWYGYHLFRRVAGEKSEQDCISERLSRFAPGPTGVATIPVGSGTLTSDTALVLTDDFAPTGRVEVDLRNRSYVRLDTPPTAPVRRVQATIGFRERPGGDAGAMTCADFHEDKPGEQPSPLERERAGLTAFDSQGNPVGVERVVDLGGHIGWSPSFRGHVRLPCPVSRVEVELAHSAKAPRVTARNADGNEVATAVMTTTGPETIVLSGSGITTVDVDAPSDETAVLRVCWQCTDNSDEGDGGLTQAIPVTVSWQGVTVAATTVTGAPGSQKTIILVADVIDRVDVGSGAAALVDLCVVGVRQGLADGWEKLDGFTYPMALPVAQGDYPCAGAPPGPREAEDLALGRVVYGPAGPWGGKPFAALHEQLERLVEDGPPPQGRPMHERSAARVGSPAPPPGVGGTISQPNQHPLHLVLLGSLQPPMAQMLGLYWWDGTAVPGVAYDYLLLADHDDSLGGEAETALKWLASVGDFTIVDGYVCFGLVAGPATPVDAPTGTRAYALPGATVTPDGGGPPIDATNNAGLTWDRRQQSGGGLEAGAPVLHHVWRADLGDVATPPDPSESDFAPLTKTAPLPASRWTMSPPQAPQHPAEWPPFRLQYIDRAGPDGWYAYRVSAVDLFGRHSSMGSSAAWWQWAPVPSPKPWYYAGPPADRLLHATRVRLLDKIPPPAPPGLEAVTLDPADPTAVQDATWVAWRNSLTATERASTIGLRAHWHWTVDQQSQAPDTREFRLYYNSAPLNTLRGRVTSVTSVGPTETEVVTDIPNTQPANSFTGLTARIGADSFAIVASPAGSPLRLRVRNLGPAKDVRPTSRSTTRCAVSIPPGHPLYEDFAAASAWHDRLLVVDYGEHVRVEANGDRFYEVLLPVAGSALRVGLPLVTPLDDPVAFGAVGVTAADSRTHTPDHQGDPARYGNESSVGGPATVLRVRREIPVAPPAPADTPKAWATPADYHGRSYYTYRWLPAPRLRTLVFRALDNAVFHEDLARRPRPALSAADAQHFPSATTELRWDQAKRQQVAAELNGLNTLDPTDKAAVRAAYAGLSNDALRVLAGLPGCERVFVQLHPQPLEPDEAEAGAPGGLRWRRVGPDVPAGSLATSERAFVDTLDGRASNRYLYRSARVDEVQNVGPLGLAGPPVALPDVTPPVAPRIARLAAGDCEVTIEWSSNREPDLAEYRVYRTFDPDAAGDIRRMDLVHTVAVAAGDPADRPKTVAWTDGPVPGLRDIWYRVVAVDRVDPDPRGGGGNVSAPSPAMRGRAYDETPPDPPELTTVEWVQVDPAGAVHPWSAAVPPDAEWLPAVALAWGDAGDGVRLLVQSMGASDEGFATASPWLAPGTTGYLHHTTRTFESREYRLKAVSGAGNANQVFHPATLLSPS
jgi:hypothetical protein